MVRGRNTTINSESYTYAFKLSTSKRWDFEIWGSILFFLPYFGTRTIELIPSSPPQNTCTQHNFSVAGGLRKLISFSYMSSFADSNLLLPSLLKHYVYPVIVAVSETIEHTVSLSLLLCHLWSPGSSCRRWSGEKQTVPAAELFRCNSRGLIHFLCTSESKSLL